MRGVVVALGNFDGVHLGHQVVLRRAVEEGRKLGCPMVAATFDPHPQAVLRPGEEPALLTTLELRRELLLRYGADEVYEIRFDRDLSLKSPEKFVRDVLIGEIGATTVVVGENFRFGYKASGDVEDMSRIMASLGGEVHAVGLHADRGEETSSTRIRALLRAGEVREASHLLGRLYVIRGEVVAGERRGRTIGFPTANLLSDPAVVVPARGVYAGRVRIGLKEYVSCMNIGTAPTFARGAYRIEAHLLDFDGDLYGRVVDVSFMERIRAEKKFKTIVELRDRIKRDIELARSLSGAGS